MGRHGGPRQASTFFKAEIVRNTSLKFLGARLNSSHGAVFCNLCGWSGPRFMTHMGAGYIVWDAFCPSCGSFPRHRGFAWLIENELADELLLLEPLTGSRFLFAPEHGMVALLEPYLSGLEGVDFNAINELVVCREDIQHVV